jgi:ribosomal protein L7/L12
MTTCRICDQQNPPGVSRCANCGAELASRGDDAAPSGAPSAKDSGVPLEPADVVAQQVLTHLRQGRKIEAIKVYRQATGVGLKDAKDAVDALGKQHGIAASGSGCAGVLCLVVVAMLVWYAC